VVINDVRKNVIYNFHQAGKKAGHFPRLKTKIVTFVAYVGKSYTNLGKGLLRIADNLVRKKLLTAKINN